MRGSHDRDRTVRLPSLQIRRSSPLGSSRSDSTASTLDLSLNPYSTLRSRGSSFGSTRRQSHGRRSRSISPQKAQDRVLRRLRADKAQRELSTDYWLPRGCDEKSPVALLPPTSAPSANRSDQVQSSDGSEKQTAWQTSYCILDLTPAPACETALDASVVSLRSTLAEVHASVPTECLSGLRPFLYSTPLFKISSPQQRKLLNNLARETPPITLELVKFRISKVQRFEEEVVMSVGGTQRPTQRSVLALEACMRSAKLGLMKDAWLRSLGDSVEAFKASLLYHGDQGGGAGRGSNSPARASYDAYVTLARVGAENFEDIKKVCDRANLQYSIGEDGKVIAASTVPSLFEMHVSGKIDLSTLDITEGHISGIPLTGEPALEAERPRPVGYISLLIADELRKNGFDVTSMETELSMASTRKMN